MSEQRLPVYRGHWLHGAFPEYRLDPLGFYLHAWRELGDSLHIRLTATRSLALFAHPDAVEHVLLKNQENYEKPPERRMLFAGSLLTSGEEEARAKRKLIQPSYRTSHSENACAVVHGSTGQFLDRALAHREGHFDPHAEMTRLTLRVASITLFACDLSDPAEGVDEAIQRCIGYMSRVADRGMTPARLPFSRERRSFRHSRDRLHALLAGILREHEAAGPGRRDILREILDRDSEGLLNPLENAFLLLLASYLTMSQVLHYALRTLAAHPEIQERARAEVEAVLGETDAGPEDLKRLPYLSAVFEEAMRLFPNFHLFYHAREDDEIGGYAVPAGTRVCLSSYVTHRHPGFWDEPERFDPERFLDAGVPRHRYAYFPFGGGPRICLGKNFALLEGPLVLATVLRRCRVEPIDENPHGPLRLVER